MQYHNLAKPTLFQLTLVASLLSACGGGGGSSDPATDASAQSRTWTSTGTTSATTSTGTTSSGTTSTAVDVNPAGPGVFIDSVNGNDANDGKTQSTPWKSLSKLVGIKLAAGNGVNLRCGSLWRESVSLTSTNLPSGSWVAGYGPCSTSLATISGADSFAGGWTKSGNIWSRKVPAGTPKITRLYVNGVPQRVAQWPNYGGIGHEYAYVSASSSSSSTQVLVAASDLPALSGKDLVGATINTRDNPWFISTRTVSAYNSTSGIISLASAASYAHSAGSGYVLQDKLWMLDAPGEFYHDQVNGILYVYPSDTAAQTNMNSITVEGTVRSVALTLTGTSGTAISNVAAVKNAVEGIALHDAASAKVSTVDASDNVSNGITIYSSSAASGGRTAGIVIQNSSFDRNSHSGIEALATTGAKIISNKIRDTGMIASAAMPGAAIDAGPGAIVQGNTVLRSGINGIVHTGAGGTQIINNLVEAACSRLTDCGGIYTWNGNNAWTTQSSIVQNNIIAHQHPNSEGAVSGATDMTAGVYNDSLTKSITVSNNYIIDVPVGVLLNDGSSQTIQSNKFWLTSKASLWVNQFIQTTDYVKNNVFSNNQFVPVSTASGTFPATPSIDASQAIWLWHASGTAAITSGANTFSGNQTVLLNGASNVTVNIKSATMQTFSASAWDAFIPAEAAPSVPATYALYLPTLGPELVSNGGFDSGLTGWKSWFYSTTGGLSASSISGCSGTCALFKAGSIYDVMNSPALQVKSGSLYLLSFSATLPNGGSFSMPGLTNTAATTTSVVSGGHISSLTNMSGSAGETIKYTGTFTAATTASATLNLAASAGTSVGYDSVSLKEITGFALSKTSDWVATAEASPDSATTVDCATLGWSTGCKVTDINGTAISLPTTIPAGSAQLFLRVDTPWKQ